MINQLKVYNVGEKVRLGSPHDGGYVLSKKAIEVSSCLFSYGIEDDITFDQDYIKLTQNKVYGYDHTINHIHTDYPELFTLYKKGISGTTQEETGNFLEHYRELGLSNRVLLKIDVEGCEFEWFENTNISELAQVVTGIVIEFHELYNHEFRDRFILILEKLNEYFYIHHVHGNNHSSFFNYNGYDIPNVIELSFIPKDLVEGQPELDDQSFPTTLDAPNNAEVIDFNLEFINK
jgi:hypothetical protein